MELSGGGYGFAQVEDRGGFAMVFLCVSSFLFLISLPVVFCGLIIWK